jgi:hypothetical protein
MALVVLAAISIGLPWHIRGRLSEVLLVPGTRIGR